MTRLKCAFQSLLVELDRRQPEVLLAVAPGVNTTDVCVQLHNDETTQRWMTTLLPESAIIAARISRTLSVGAQCGVGGAAETSAATIASAWGSRMFAGGYNELRCESKLLSFCTWNTPWKS
eukprot:750493-Hanusia_phi.AAC.4